MLLRHVQSAHEIQALLSAYCTRNVSAMSVARTRGRQPCRTCTADIRGHGLYPKLEWRGYFIGATDQSVVPGAFCFSFILDFFSTNIRRMARSRERSSRQLNSRKWIGWPIPTRSPPLAGTCCLLVFTTSGCSQSGSRIFRILRSQQRSVHVQVAQALGRWLEESYCKLRRTV